MLKKPLVAAVVAALAVGCISYASAATTAASQPQGDSQDSQSSPASSSSSPQTMRAVTVTGSRIRSVDVETAQPVVTMTQEDIQRTGLITLGDILQNSTVSGTPTFSKAAVLASNTEEGGQYVNLYDLGENRTLVLVNGKRWMTSLAGLTDLSTIPTALIDHIDILKDGASSIYGSDAIAGVVNIILKDHFNGAEFDGEIGQNQGGDGRKQQYSITFGNTTDRSTLMFSATYNKTDPIWAKSRKLTKYTYGPYFGLQGLSGTGPWGRYTDADGNTFVLNHTGDYNGQGVGADSRLPGSYHAGVNYPDDYYNPTLQMMEALPTKLKSIFTGGSYNLTDNIRFTAKGMYAERDSSTQVAGYPFNTAILVPGINPAVVLSGDSYYNPTGKDVDVARRIIELPRTSSEEAKSLYFDAGFDGEFQVGDYPWDWDTGFAYTKYDVDTTLSGNLNLLNMQKALGPSFLNSAGVVQCGTSAAPIALSQCVPFDILGGPSASTPDALNYVNALEQPRMQSTSKDFTANITGGLFEMPLNAGTFSFAAGLEHRQIEGYNHPDPLASQGYTTDLVSGPTGGGYTTNEAYLELSIPVLKNLPGVKELAFDIASRYSHYSNFGGTTNNKYSFTYTPFEDLKLRGTFAKGFRAPTISDLYGGGSQTFDDYTDPCDAVYGSTDIASVAQNCAAAGLPTGFRQHDTAGNAVQGPGQQSTTPFFTGTGNTNLQPEKSTTRTAGLIYSPHYVDGLDITLDYYDIKITNVITSISADYTLTQCYQYSVQAFCDQFSRDANGQVVGLREGTTNLGWVETKGYNFRVDYRLPRFDIGQFGVSLDSNYIDEYTQQSQPGAPKINYAGQWGTPHWRANASVEWQKGNWGASWTMRYYGAFLDECWSDTEHCNKPNYESKNWGYGKGADRIGAVVMNDVRGSYALPWNASVAVGIRNVFDKHPPITFSVTNNSSSSVDPALDLTRYVYVQYNQKF